MVCGHQTTSGHEALPHWFSWLPARAVGINFFWLPWTACIPPPISKRTKVLLSHIQKIISCCSPVYQSPTSKTRPMQAATSVICEQHYQTTTGIIPLENSPWGITMVLPSPSSPCLDTVNRLVLPWSQPKDSAVTKMECKQTQKKKMSKRGILAWTKMNCFLPVGSPNGRRYAKSAPKSPLLTS